MVRELGVEKVGPLIDTFFRTAYDIVVSHDGIVDKFMGDACMALFNAPVKYDDHVARAVATAIGLQRAVDGINASRRGEEGVLRVGIGINTGFALVGRLGSNHPSDYTAIGDVVNIASRLQGHAAPGEVLVAEEVYEAVKDAFPNAGRREYQLKGIPDPIAAYALT